MQRTFIYAAIALICSLSVFAIVAFQFFTLYSSNANTSWETCKVTITTITPTFIYPYRHVKEYQLKVYVADTPEKLQEGYRFKDSYDFLGKGASGILLDVRPYAEATVTITMQDARLPLTVIVLSSYDSGYKIESWKELNPEENWNIQLPKNNPVILELDPSIGKEILAHATTIRIHSKQP